MNNQPEGHYVSFHLNVKGGEQDAVFCGTVIMADGRKIGLADGSYFVRVWTEPDRQLVRGTINLEGTEQVIRFQSGDKVGNFIRECLAKHSQASAMPSTTPREEGDRGQDIHE